jgi:pimeloyl-ACP methyl ester carboxylesterase
MFRTLHRCLCLCLAVLLSSCDTLQSRRNHAEAIAQHGGLEADSVETDQFTLRVFHKGLDQHSDVLAVYIEGDGMAWRRRSVLSDDPTPADPVSLKLAARDPGPAVLHIARPCQYLAADELTRCAPKYWSSHRYSIEVLSAMSSAIDWGLRRSGAGSVLLFGYSGGGVIATLLAARRSDVIALVTVAANLDHGYWTAMHGISPLTGSLDAADVAGSIAHILQLHLVGEEDEIVPPTIIEAYRKRSPESARIAVRIVPGFDHHCCWEKAWPELVCRGGVYRDRYCEAK